MTASTTSGVSSHKPLALQFQKDPRKKELIINVLTLQFHDANKYEEKSSLRWDERNHSESLPKQNLQSISFKEYKLDNRLSMEKLNIQKISLAEIKKIYRRNNKSKISQPFRSKMCKYTFPESSSTSSEKEDQKDNFDEPVKSTDVRNDSLSIFLPRTC